MPKEQKHESRNVQNKRQKLQYLVYASGAFLLFLGICLLLFTSRYISIKNHFSIIFIVIGIFVIIIVATYREMFERPMPNPKMERIRAIQEQVIDIVVKRAKRYGLLIGVLAYFGIVGYIQTTFGPKLTQIERAITIINSAEADLKKIQQQSTKIDSLRKEIDHTSQYAINLKRSLSDQESYFKKRLTIFDSSLYVQASTEMKNILKRGKLLDREYAEIRENQSYKVTIHYSTKHSSIAEKVGAILEGKGFQVYYDEMNEKEIGLFSGFKGRLFYYISEDKNKAELIERLIRDQGISIMGEGKSNPKNAKKFDIWP